MADTDASKTLRRYERAGNEKRAVLSEIFEHFQGGRQRNEAGMYGISQ